MGSPCDNCITLPVCNKKDPFNRIGRCTIISNHIFQEIVAYDFENDKIHLPHKVIIFDCMFDVSHYPMMNSMSEYSDVCGVGLLPTLTNRNMHVTIGRVPGRLKLTTNQPIKKIDI